MKKIFISFLLLFSSYICAQNISVSSFRQLESDLTANTAGTIEKDQNGETAALIKVVTTQTGFTFDGGALGIVKTVQKPSEIWVYVPRGLKKITISHPQLGLLRDYYLNIPIEAARTYEMVLVTGSVQTIINQDAGGQYLVMNVDPPTSIVYIDDNEVTLQNGSLSKFLSYGNHTYRITDPLHATDAGSFEIGKEKKVLDIKLQPSYGILQISTSPENGAKIFIDDDTESAGLTPFTTKKMKKGLHQFRFQLSGYESKTITHDVHSDGSTQPLVVPLTSNFASVTIKVEDGCTLYINNEEKSVGSWKGRLAEGLYRIEARKPRHNPVRETINVVKGEDKIVSLAPPTPIYGKLNVNSKPIGATVKIGGKIVGTTPDIIDNVLIGNQELTVELNGYKSIKRNINISEGKITEFDCELEKINTTGKKTEMILDKKVILKSSSDSVSYAGGMSVTDGLKVYLKEQKVDTDNHMNSFVKGFIEGLEKTESKQGKAYQAGIDIGNQVIERMLPNLEKDIQGRYVINKELFYQGFIDALNKDEHIFKMKDAQKYFKEHK